MSSLFQFVYFHCPSHHSIRCAVSCGAALRLSQTTDTTTAGFTCQVNSEVYYEVATVEEASSPVTRGTGEVDIGVKYFDKAASTSCPNAF